MGTGSGPLIDIYGEDRTGGGLQALLVAAAQARRDELGTPRLRVPQTYGTAKNNERLLRECEKYELRRFHSSVRFDHIFYVIDARNADHLMVLPSNDLPGYCDQLRGEMQRRARGKQTDPSWEGMKAGFHAHVLVWERESLILPVADALGLGKPHPNPHEHRQAAEWVDQRFRDTHGVKYAKGIDGLTLLSRIARDPALRDRVIAGNPSVAAMVEDLAAI